ncbi:protein kinase domain-containing protein [Paucibacter sp. M5-1]|uniref:protein kinase domain-containing protein n=1 Tax=Paucibacter sp. M5-1 TaxID=3015998 RepID=UPI0022B86573|nr:protein kinase [Paucibacter sp. M5-1]MCZ7882486.1 protein kinase [Paucibacter sp. M5-1]
MSGGRPIDKARWLQLSPVLDELLDLDEPARAGRLAAVQALDPGLAEDLQALLARDAALGGQDFMARPALPPMLDQPVLALPGQTLGAYTLANEIGQGGMGSVWLARRTDGRFEGQVAIKLLASGLFGAGSAGRFAREGQILAKLSHPHIARLLDAGISAEDGPRSGQPYLVLEYVDGQPIDAFCEERQLDTRARITLFLDVLAAVAHAHNRLILHRDLKPSNILVNRAGEVKLLDFGIAKLLDGEAEDGAGGAATELTRQAGRAFTPQYAAPEQVQGGEVSTATDVYALGVLLYLLLSGIHPTAKAEPSTTPLERMRSIVETEPKRLSEAARRQANPVIAERARTLRGDLDTIVAKALKKKPAERYANAELLAADLRRWLAHEPVSARPDSAWYRSAMFLRRHRLGVAAGSGVVLALGLGLGVAIHEGREAQHQRDQAEGLIEFMLGDLRKKLEPVGRLDVMDAVGDKALGYYSQQQLSGMDASSLGRRARALHLMGEIAEKRGKLDEADQLFRQAAASTGELLARHPDKGAVVFEHAQSAYWVGFIARRRGQMEEAQRHFQQYLQLAERLSALEPGNVDWRTERAFAQQNLGVLALDQGRARAALDEFRRTDASWRSVVEQRPELYLEQANTLGWIARANFMLGDYAAALATDKERIEALRNTPGATENREVQSLLASSQHQISRMHFFLDQGEQALLWAERAAQTQQALVSLDRDNLEWLQSLSAIQLRQAEVLNHLGQLAQAQALAATLHTDVSRLISANPGKLDLQCLLRGQLLTLQAKLDGTAAIEPLRHYLKEMQDIEGGDKTLNAEQRLAVGRAALRLGRLLAQTPETAAQASRYWHAAEEYLRPAGPTLDAQSVTLHAQTRFLLGAPEEARALAEKVAATTYRHPDYVELLQMIKPAATAARQLTGKDTP